MGERQKLGNAEKRQSIDTRKLSTQAPELLACVRQCDFRCVRVCRLCVHQLQLFPCASCSFAFERIKDICKYQFNENAFAFTCYFIKGTYKLEKKIGVVGDWNLTRPLSSPVY